MNDETNTAPVTTNHQNLKEITDTIVLVGSMILLAVLVIVYEKKRGE